MEIIITDNDYQAQEGYYLTQSDIEDEMQREFWKRITKNYPLENLRIATEMEKQEWDAWREKQTTN